LVNTNPVPAIGGPSGMTPSQIHTAYNIPTGSGSGAIAVVEAYDYPQALSDFNVFSSEFGLPTETSNTVTASTNQVLQVVYAGGTEPRSDPDWAQETALDAQWAHALAPNAKIYVVEAASSDLDDLMTAVSIAKGLPNVRQVSMSFGSSETGCNYVDYDSTFLQQGVAFFVAAGDSPGTVSFPPASANVVAVGATTLNVANDGTWLSETVWNSTGCGPSTFEPRPSFQNVVAPIVGEYRGTCDIAADGDPNTGLSVYDSLPDQGSSGWVVLGGTSAATPIIAGIANVSGTQRTSSQNQNVQFYANIGSNNFHDITSGSSSGFNALTGWDYPTGVGTPNGTGGF
jgi:subtilase family serine protease